MEKTTLRFLLFYVFFISSLSVHQSSAKTQTETLSQFYKAKRKIDSAIDKGHYTPDHPVIHDHHILSQKGLKEKDKIHRLPGQPSISAHKFEQYGGYVTVNVTYGRALYYYFVEANSDKKDLPLLLWLNGGPGCSSIGYGAFEELGPFRVNSDGKTLYSNTYAWNHAANVLFLESPAGVGFSYSNSTNDPNLEAPGDKKTADDNLIFLLNWLERFPEYKKRDFYISGESYAGHYVPQLAHNILSHNKHSNMSVINLKGIIFGNAVINDETDNWGMYDYFASHALVSDKDVEEMHKVCNFSDGAEVSEECRLLDETVSWEMGNIDIYNIYAPICLNSTPKPKRGSISKYDPCSDDYIHAYLNQPEVQQALHANVTKIPYDWESCSEALFQQWTDSPSTVIPLLKELLANGIRVWIYSGDTDGRVPVTSTRYSINAMKLPVTSSWRPWYLHSEVGGYTEGYGKNLTFATVRYAGHEVPSYQPARAFTLINSFLAGKPLPSS